MKISPAQFDSLLKNKRLTVTLVGMSNIGKTYWSERFTELGFTHVNCDSLIEKELQPEMSAFGYSGLADVSGWMGQPYTKRYSTHQKIYLDKEKNVMGKIIEGIRKGNRHNVVIDTTGSVVHTGNTILSDLKQHSLVVCIEASKEMTEEMFTRYMQEPKPVVFGEFFKQRKSESDQKALARSYRDLLDARRALGRRYADVVIPSASVKKNMTIEQFISLIKQAL